MRKSKWMTGGYSALRRCGCARSGKGTQFHCLEFRLGSAGELTVCSHCYDVLNEEWWLDIFWSGPQHSDWKNHKLLKKICMITFFPSVLTMLTFQHNQLLRRSETKHNGFSVDQFCIKIKHTLCNYKKNNFPNFFFYHFLFQIKVFIAYHWPIHWKICSQ